MKYASVLSLIAAISVSAVSSVIAAETAAPPSPVRRVPQPPPGWVNHIPVNPGAPWESGLMEARAIAAAIVAQAKPEPKFVVDVGSYLGTFLAVFMDKFPNARGQWTEPVDGNLGNAKKLLGPYGNRVSYKIGCPSRDISDGCVPRDADVIITSWLSIHQNLDGMYKVYRLASEQLPPGGWMVSLDHVSFGGSDWESWMQAARKDFRPFEGPPIHHDDYRLATVEEQLGALRAAGFADPKVVWQSFNTVMFMGRKN
jgi:hypothetical protein